MGRKPEKENKRRQASGPKPPSLEILERPLLYCGFPVPWSSWWRPGFADSRSCLQAGHALLFIGL